MNKTQIFNLIERLEADMKAARKVALSEIALSTLTSEARALQHGYYDGLAAAMGLLRNSVQYEDIVPVPGYPCHN